MQSLRTPQVSQLEGGWMNARFAVLRLRHRVECIRLGSDRFIVERKADNHSDMSSRMADDSSAMG
jgi:hypothetical protein